MSVPELIQAGNMDARMAAMFWIGMERGASIIIAADPPSSGKTTTLSALLAFTPPDTAVYFTRGVGESFALPNLSPAYHTYVLINELSDHIPVYTWHDDARRAFELLARGYRLGSTMHADTVDGVLAQLRGDLGIPESHVANVTFIVPLYVGHLHPPMRRVSEVAFLQPNGDGIKMANLATWDQAQDQFQTLEQAEQREAFATWAGLSDAALEKELGKRESFLKALIKNSTTSIPEVTAAVESFYEKSARNS
jgi:hypothetical protein